MWNYKQNLDCSPQIIAIVKIILKPQSIIILYPFWWGNLNIQVLGLHQEKQASQNNGMKETLTYLESNSLPWSCRSAAQSSDRQFLSKTVCGRHNRKVGIGFNSKWINKVNSLFANQWEFFPSTLKRLCTHIQEASSPCMVREGLSQL
jgi:hypothetical protein